MARSIFITGTDTGAGKTWVTAGVIRRLLERGVSARALKPVASGLDTDGHNEDVETLLAAQQLNDADAISLYRFALPASPHIAAEAEGQQIDPAILIDWCRQQAEGMDICLIEGVGGLMVPLTGDFTVCDWIRAMPETEIWLVAGARLGAINHTLLTLEKLQAIGRFPTKVILNDPANDPVTLDHLARTISGVVTPDALFSLATGEERRLQDMIDTIA